MRIRTIPVVQLCLLLYATTGTAQDVYVDAENGSNFNSGLTPGDAWQTVDWALRGSHAPLPGGTTIHLLGTSSKNYTPTDSNEIFPWLVYDNVSLVADKSPSAPNVIVDAENQQNIVEYDPAFPVTSALIDGITFRNGLIGIKGSPNATAFAPTITNCVFDGMVDSIRIDASPASVLDPTIRQCVDLGSSNSFIWYSIQGAISRPVFEDNQVTTTGSNGIVLTGNSTSGTASVLRNQITANRAVWVNSYLGVVDLLDNTLDGGWFPSAGRALVIQTSNPWSSDSRVTGNTILTSDIGIWVNTTDNVVIEQNQCDGNINSIWLDPSDGSVVRKNTCDNNGTGVAILSGGDGCRIEENEVLRSSGKGISIKGADTYVSQNTVRNVDDLGVHLQSSAVGAVLSGNVIVGSQTAGVLVSLGGVTVVGNDISFTSPGPGIRDTTGEANVFSSNLCHNNFGRGIEILATSVTVPPMVVHNTFADNTGEGMFSALGNTVSSFYVVNNIMWGNNGSGPDISGASSQIAYCNIEDGGVPGNGNILADPEFVNRAGFDYHLLPTSPCLDTGTPPQGLVKAWATDLDGSPRVLDGDFSSTTVTDMGADELTELLLVLSGSYQQGSVLTVTIVGGSTAAGAPYAVYASSDDTEQPFAPVPGVEHPFFGTVILDPARLVSPNPVLTGNLDAAGNAVRTLNLPGGGFVGDHFVVQATVGGPGFGWGQTSNTQTFELMP